MNRMFIFLLFAFLIVPAAQATVQITKMSDYAFGSWSGTGNMQLSDTVCIYDSQANSQYGITATGSGGGGAFTVTSGALTIAYTVEHQGSITAMTTLTAGVKSLFNDANRASTTCGGGTNSTTRITFTEANLQAADAGTYTGTLTVLLTRN